MTVASLPPEAAEGMNSIHFPLGIINEIPIHTQEGTDYFEMYLNSTKVWKLSGPNKTQTKQGKSKTPLGPSCSSLWLAVISMGNSVSGDLVHRHRKEPTWLFRLCPNSTGFVLGIRLFPKYFPMFGMKWNFLKCSQKAPGAGSCPSHPGMINSRVLGSGSHTQNL